MLNKTETGSDYRIHEGGRRGVNVPKLSVAKATPPWNFTPTTDVPVTAGDEVCDLGPVV